MNVIDGDRAAVEYAQRDARPYTLYDPVVEVLPHG